MTSRSTLLNAFWKTTNTEYSGDCHSSDCLMMICSVAMWSVLDLSWQKPHVELPARAFSSLSRMILVRILLGMETSMIPHQLLHDDRSPFFHSSGICSVSQIFIRSGWIISVEVWTSAFSASGGMPSGLAALPNFKDLMALLTSALVGGLVFTSSWFVAGGMSGGT